MKKVSIIIPVYNTSKFLARCLNSVVNQSYKNIEIIVINDGSTDGSFEICREFESLYKNIILINKENTGQSDSRYQGFLRSTGDYIYCVDSDDYIFENTIEILVEGIEKYKADMFYARFQLVSESGGILAETSKYDVQSLRDQTTIINDALISRNIKTSLCIKLVKRNIWEKCCTEQIRKIRFNEDYFLTVLFASYSNKIAFSNEIIYNAVQRSGSTSRKVRSELVTTHDIYFNLIRKEFYRRNIQNGIERYYYIGYAKNLIYSLIIAANNSNSFDQYYILFSHLKKESIFYSPAFNKALSLSYKILTEMIKVPRVFYFSAKTYSLFKKH